MSVLYISPTNFYNFEASESKQNILLRTKVYKAEYIAWAKKKTILKNSNRELAKLHTPIFTQK